MSYLFPMILIAIVVSMASSLLGTFLVLRGAAMVSDAITHTVLLGIVLAYFVVHDLDSPFLMLGATLVGLLTVWLIELVSKSKLINYDGAIGVVFPFLFGLAIILLTQYASGTHLDVDAVLMGELGFAPFNRLIINGVDLGPVALVRMSIILVINILFVTIFYRQLKITTFDPGFARSIGISPSKYYYALMTLVSLTAVGSYEAVGSVLVVGFVVGPALAGYMLSDDLKHIIGLAMVFSVLNSVIGVYLAYQFDTTFAGMIAVVTGVTTMLVMVFSPKKGLVRKLGKSKSYSESSAWLSSLGLID